MVLLFTSCHPSPVQECAHTAANHLWSPQGHLQSSLKRAGTTATCTRALSKEPASPVFQGVFSTLCQNKMRLSVERAIFFPLLKYVKPTKVSGYTLRRKSHIHYRNQTLSHKEPSPKSRFLTQDKTLCLWKKYTPADRGEQVGGRCFLHQDGSAIRWIWAGHNGAQKPHYGLSLTRAQPFTPNLRWVIDMSLLDSRQMVQMQSWCHGGCPWGAHHQCLFQHHQSGARQEP